MVHDRLLMVRPIPELLIRNYPRPAPERPSVTVAATATHAGYSLPSLASSFRRDILPASYPISSVAGVYEDTVSHTLYAPLTMQGVSVMGLVDTGSDINVMSYSLLNRLPSHPSLIPCPLHVKSANSTALTVYGMLTIPVTMGDIQRMISAVVVHPLQTAFIIGMPMLVDYRSSVDVAGKMLHVGATPDAKSLPAPVAPPVAAAAVETKATVTQPASAKRSKHSPDRPAHRILVFADEHVTLRPYSTCFLTATTKGTQFLPGVEHYLLTPIRRANPYGVATAYLDHNALHPLLVMVTNFQGCPHNIPKGARLAFLEPLQDADVMVTAIDSAEVEIENPLYPMRSDPIEEITDADLQGRVDEARKAGLTPEQASALLAVLNRHKKAFAANPSRPGIKTDVQHTIDLIDPRVPPVKVPPHRTNPLMEIEQSVSWMICCRLGSSRLAIHPGPSQW